MREFHVACEVCKALGDIPEVQAVIRLLDDLVQEEFAVIAERVLAEIMRRLDEFRTTSGLPDVDVLRRGVTEADRQRREDLLVAILASLMLYIERSYSAPVSQEIESAVAVAVDRLLQEGARGEGLGIDLGALEIVRQAARAEFQAALAATVLLRRDQIEQALRRFLTSGNPRARLSALEAPGSSAEGRGAFVSSLTQILLPAAALTATIDAWAYRAFNVGAAEAVLASVEGSQGFVLRLRAVRDDRTTRFCRWVDGRIVSAAKVRQQIDEHARAALQGDVVGMAASYPYLSPDLARGGNPLQFERFFRRAGIPPFHFGCRTRVRREQA